MTQNKGRSAIASRIKAIIATIVILIGLAIIIVFIKMQKNNGRRARKYCSLFFPLNGFKLEKIGEYDLDAKLIVVNHRSLTDIICLEGDHPLNICWVAKKELGEPFFYGHALKGPKMILIDREDKKGFLQLLKEVKDRLSQDRPIIIFPEGTRSKIEMDFLPFRSGAKMIAEKFKLKIQPIVLINTKEVYNSSPLTSTKDTIRMVLMPGFTPDFENDENWYENLRNDMLEVYKKNYTEMNGEVESL